MKQSLETQQKKENPMRAIFIEKILLSASGTDTDLEKAAKLLTLITGKKSQIIASTKRIPDFGVSPGLKVGARVTVRREQIIQLLSRLLAALVNTLKTNQISDNHFSFGIKEYIEIPEMEYQRDIGIRGFNVTVSFARKGLRIKKKKIKSSKIPKKQQISRTEIIKFME